MAIDPDVLAFLSGLEFRTASMVPLKTDIPLPLWTRVKRAVEDMGGFWDKEGRELCIPRGPAHLEWLRRYGDPPKPETFSTPADLAGRMAAWAIKPGDRVLEPSVGEGNLALAALEAGAASVTGYDVDTKFLARARERGLTDVHLQDFMHIEIGGPFDAIIMCPPFGMQRDMHHVNRALRWLKPGGRLTALVSHGAIHVWTDAIGDNFRVMVRRLGAIHKISSETEWPLDFKSDTPRLVTLTKPAE